MYVQHNGRKKGLCLDLSQPEGLEIARDLVKRSDVVVEAFGEARARLERLPEA